MQYALIRLSSFGALVSSAAKSARIFRYLGSDGPANRSSRSDRASNKLQGARGVHLMFGWLEHGIIRLHCSYKAEYRQSFGRAVGRLPDPIIRAREERVRLLASLRLLWEKCGSANAATDSLPTTNPSSSTWSEPFPPKLSGEAINQLRRTFTSSNPGRRMHAEQQNDGAGIKALTSW